LENSWLIIEWFPPLPLLSWSAWVNSPSTQLLPSEVAATLLEHGSTAVLKATEV
jgi:hypothetical protein